MSLGPAIAIFWSGGRSVFAVRALVVGQLCWFAADLLSPQDDRSVLMLALGAMTSMVLWVGPWLLFAPRRSRLWREPLDVDRALLYCAGVVGVPLVLWSLTQTGLTVTGEGPHVPLRELRFDMTGLPLVLAVAGVLAALHGVRWGMWAVALAWTYVGVLAMAFDHDWASPGAAVGAALVVGGSVGPSWADGQQRLERINP